MPEPKITIGFLSSVVSAIAVAFAIFFFMDSRHAHPIAVEATAAEINQRILMAESARYAEVSKYYLDKLQDGEPLSKAETSRLDLVQRQQERIALILTGKDE